MEKDNEPLLSNLLNEDKNELTVDSLQLRALASAATKSNTEKNSDSSRAFSNINGEGQNLTPSNDNEVKGDDRSVRRLPIPWVGSNNGRDHQVESLKRDQESKIILKINDFVEEKNDSVNIVISNPLGEPPSPSSSTHYKDNQHRHTIAGISFPTIQHLSVFNKHVNSSTVSNEVRITKDSPNTDSARTQPVEGNETVWNLHQADPSKLRSREIEMSHHQQKHNNSNHEHNNHEKNINNHDKNTNICPICVRPFPRPLETYTIPVKKLKPRFFKNLRKLVPNKTLSITDRVCIKDLHTALQQRIEELLEEDQFQFAKLQEDAMKNLEQYEQAENTWQDRFDQKRTFGQKAADTVAAFGGSWKFVLGLLGFLIIWACLNLILENFAGSTWDPYPFILLNLFLSTMAAFQAPIIMMSQNRQGQKDREMNGFVSKIILRAENQTRHVNAKVDHLITHQWKRLLEIQEIQVDLLQVLQQQQKSVLGPQKQPSSLMPERRLSKLMTSEDQLLKQFWNTEIIPDNHTRVLLRHYYQVLGYEDDEEMFFAHWHDNGDNFVGYFENVQVEYKNSFVIRYIQYNMTFSDAKATLDDILSGDGTVTLRNDFDLKCMELQGKIQKIEVHFHDRIITYNNGELPARYKPSFAARRNERITDLWKLPIKRLVVTYIPPNQLAVLHLGGSQFVENVMIDFCPLSKQSEGLVYMCKMAPEAINPKILETMMGPNASEYLSSSDQWIPLQLIPSSNENSQDVFGSGSPRTKDLIAATNGLWNHVSISLTLEGPATYTFVCLDCKVEIHATIEKN